MHRFTRCTALFVFALVTLLLAVAGAGADTQWPSLFRYTLSLSSDETARYQTSASLSGPIAENMSAKVEGWWIGGEGDDRAFVGDAYLDFKRNPVYLAGGRKYTVFGPAGVLVSPGIFGGEVKFDTDGWTLQALAGTLQFTPGTGTTRFNFTGARAPSDESITAVRVARVLTPVGAAVPVKIGVNWVDVVDDTGTSVDAEIGALRWLTLYGEAADYDDANANLYGVRLSDAGMREDGRAWILVYYHRDIDVGFVPAAVGASSYFEGQSGWAGGLYYQMNSRNAIGVFSDDQDAILTWFGTIPLTR